MVCRARRHERIGRGDSSVDLTLGGDRRDCLAAAALRATHSIPPCENHLAKTNLRPASLTTQNQAARKPRTPFSNPTDWTGVERRFEALARAVYIPVAVGDNWQITTSGE